MHIPEFIELVPSLERVVRAHGMDLERVTVGVPRPDDGGRLPTTDRSQVLIADAESGAAAVWEVVSLRELFRGGAPAPASLATPADEYLAFLFNIEAHVLSIADALCAPARDGDVVEAFSGLKRRPDGRSAGFVHDSLWQATALSLGLYPTSAAEYEALMGRLVKSARRWQQHASSQAYTRFLRDHLFG